MSDCSTFALNVIGASGPYLAAGSGVFARPQTLRPGSLVRESVVFGRQVLGGPHGGLGAIGDVDALEQAAAV